jgi:hypothetical protein
MNLKRIIGILIAVVGLASIFFANHIKAQVGEGKEKVSSAEKSVGQGQSLFGSNPVTQQIGQKALFDPAQKKINAGKEEIAYYETLASRLEIGGAILIVVGLGIAFIPFSRKRG